MKKDTVTNTPSARKEAFLKGTLSRLFAKDTRNSCPPEQMIPDKKAITEIIKNTQALFFSGFFAGTEDTPHALLSAIYDRTAEQIGAAFSFSDAPLSEQTVTEKTEAFIATLPMIREKLLRDMDALYEGDPAAKCKEEILLCYPGFYAVSVYRIAHSLYSLGVPLLPRMMTEYAHEKTGIDIHAGATIGDWFFIDHGTGIVIGETTTIGDHVKLYQGVTLGAKSFELDENGNPVKGIKRHPDIGNNVIIYANATILGGDTRIGDNSVIGGNVWLTSSVEAGSRITYKWKE